MFSKIYKTGCFSIVIYIKFSSNAHRICDHLGEIGFDGFSVIDVAPNQLHHLRQMVSSLSLTLLICWMDLSVPSNFIEETQRVELYHNDGEFWEISINHSFIQEFWNLSQKWEGIFRLKCKIIFSTVTIDRHVKTHSAVHLDGPGSSPGIEYLLTKWSLILIYPKTTRSPASPHK